MNTHYSPMRNYILHKGRGMLKKINFIKSFVFVSLVLSAISCGGGGGGGGSSSGGEGELVKEVSTRCGVVKDAKLVNPFGVYDGDLAVLEYVVGSTILQVKRVGSTTSEYVSMYGLAPSESVNRIKLALAQYVGSQVFLVKATDSACIVPVRGAGTLEAYQVVTESGVNLAETIVDQGLGELTTSSQCGENLFVSCLSGSTATSPTSSSRQVSNFLWKPESESGYNPGGLSVILNPCDVRVFVNNEEVIDYGSGNGRCITARSPHPGCDYGTNAVVRITEKNTGLPVLFGTSETYTIPNGCERTEYAGIGGVSVGEDEELPECDGVTNDLTYKPAWPECGGNAGVLMTGEFADAFNSALRMPDNSDRLDPACKENACSPYKTQNFVDVVGGKIACYGAPGTSPLMSEVVQVSVKLTGDDRTPYRECLADPSKES